MSGVWSAWFRRGRGHDEVGGPSSSEETRLRRKASRPRARSKGRARGRLPRKLSSMEGALVRRRPAPFMRSGGKRTEWSVQRKAGLRAESEQQRRLAPRLGDPKRVKRHETRHSPASERKLGGPESDVKLGFSFFEKWVFRLKVRRISRRRRSPNTRRPFEAAPIPAPRSRRSATVRVGMLVRRVVVRVVFQPDFDASGGSYRPSEPIWARRFECPAPHR